MRMTLNLPDAILAEAMKNSDAPNKTALIVAALEEYVRKRRIEIGRAHV